jgi:hypothetical protein
MENLFMTPKDIKYLQCVRIHNEAEVNYASQLLLGDVEYLWNVTRLMIEANNQKIT